VQHAQVDGLGKVKIEPGPARPFAVAFLAPARQRDDAHAGPAAIGAVLYVALGASLLAPLLYMAGVARVGAARAGLFLHLIPVFGALLAAGLLGEALHAYHALGIAVIAAGLLVSNRTSQVPRPCAQAANCGAC
jgi:drug/metabolite transporter (DMT)-like permease